MSDEQEVNDVQPVEPEAVEPEAPAEAEKPAGPPETYVFSKVKIDEDEVDVPENVVTELTAFAKAHGLTQEQAQALAEREVKADTLADAQRAEAIAALQAQWAEELRVDKEFGSRFEENLGHAKRALEAFFPDLAEAADRFPFLDHPAVVRGLHKIGTRIGEDSDYVGGAAGDPSSKGKRSMFAQSVSDYQRARGG